jgi:glutathione synthase/RimK-type ligase-like ATP-grasp enzyme
MIIGIHPDRTGKESYSEKWQEFLQARNVDVMLLDLLAADGLEQAVRCDGVMWRWVHTPQFKQTAQRILYVIEHHLEIPVFPDSRTAWHYDEKVSQYYLLKTLKAPIPRTLVFWDESAALTWARSAPYPLIFKLAAGAGAANVLKIDHKKEADRLIRQAFREGIFSMTFNEYRSPGGFPRSLSQAQAMLRRLRDAARYLWRGRYPPLPAVWWKPEYGYVLFQEFLPGNDFDTRITVIGERAFGFRRMNRPGEFRASGSGAISFDFGAIDPRCLEIAFALSERAGFQSMAYDFLFKNGEPVIAEISYTFADWAVQACPGHWDRLLSWREGRMWPEEAQVEDFIRRVRSGIRRRPNGIGT